MIRIKIKDILAGKYNDQKIEVKGWVRTFRSNRFIALNDGSCLSNFQLVVNYENFDQELIKKITTGASLAASGKVVESQGAGQSFELQVDLLEIIGLSDPEQFPLQPKKHSLEFLRENAHLRVRTNTISAIYRIRHNLIFAVHKFFHDKGFYNVHTPIITGSDAEGAGEMFSVSSLDLANVPLTEDGSVDYSKDFFGKETNLTVSGQLEVETAALALTEVYTFGPTFRAENSNTSRHLAEFWMVEPEMAFYDLHDSMDLAEELVKSLVNFTLENCAEDLTFLDKRLADEEQQKPQHERQEMGLLAQLKFILENDFERLTYTEAIDILKNCKPNKKKKFKFIIDEWGADLQSEHERFLVEKHFKKPVILYDYPANIKAFYMRQNDDAHLPDGQGKTVAAMDVLFPGIGEIIGGSQREERYDILVEKIKALGIDEKALEWYLDTRKYGTAPHSGFGLGFERMMQFITGMGNIRDVIPFPRTPGNAEY